MVSRGQVPRVLAAASPFTSASSGSHALPAHSCASSPAGRQRENPPQMRQVESNSAFFQRQRELVADAQDQSAGRAVQQRSQSRAGWEEEGLAPRRQGGRGAEDHTPQERRRSRGCVLPSNKQHHSTAQVQGHRARGCQHFHQKALIFQAENAAFRVYSELRLFQVILGPNFYLSLVWILQGWKAP